MKIFFSVPLDYQISQINLPINTSRLQLEFKIDLDNHTIQKNINTKQEEVLGKKPQLYKIFHPFQ